MATRQFISTLFRFILSYKIQKFLARNFSEEIRYEFPNW